LSFMLEKVIRSTKKQERRLPKDRPSR